MDQATDCSPKEDWPDIPQAAEFPARPATWYLFGRSSEIAGKPVSKQILNRRLVAYRTADGNVAVLDAKCAHLGADLGRGRVVDGNIECPYHHWSYSSDGRCASIPASTSVPATARLRVYPAVERHGYVFFFHAPQPLFPLPFFPDCDPIDFVASAPFRFSTDCAWFMLVANGFDGQHFQAVHERRLTSEPRTDCPAAFARRIRFDAEIVGHSVFDRLLKKFAGKAVRVSITAWGGPHVLVEGVFGRAHSRLLVASQPVDEYNTLSEVIVFAKRGRTPMVRRLTDRINLRIRSRFTRAFMQYDIDKLSGVRYQPAGLTGLDREIIEYFRWIATLPHSEYEES